MNWYIKRFNCSVDSNWIYYSLSVMYLISKFIEMLSNEGDGIFINIFVYNVFYDVIINNNCNIIKLYFVNRNGFYLIDFNDFEKKCKKFKIFILCNFYNLIGRVWSELEFVKMIGICKNNDVKIILDDIYMDIVYDNRMIFILNVVKDYLDFVFICILVFKFFNILVLIGLYVIILNEGIRNKFENIIRYCDFVNLLVILVILVIMVCYDDCEYWLDELLKYFKENFKYMIDYIKDNLELLKLVMLEGCYFVWIDFFEFKISGEKF